jgi:hypothetical protein
MPRTVNPELSLELVNAARYYHSYSEDAEDKQEIIEALIDDDTDLNFVDSTGRTALMWFCRNLEVSMAANFIWVTDGAPDVNLISPNQQTALTNTLTYLKYVDNETVVTTLAILNLLINAHVNVNALDSKALRIAVDTLLGASGDESADLILQVVNKLLSAPGIDLHINWKLLSIPMNNLQFETGITKLPAAIKQDVMNGLLDRAVTERSKSVTRKLVQSGANIDSLDTALKKAYARTTMEDSNAKPYGVKTRSDAAIFDMIFSTDAPVGQKSDALNFSTCPICFQYTVRSVACNYIQGHNCSAHGNYYNVDLYNRYKNDEGNITWCTICGRIALGHRHYKLLPWTKTDVTAADLVTTVGQTNPFEDDCSVTSGGGGLKEKLMRFRAAREVMRTIDPKTPYREAMDRVLMAMWDAPLHPLNAGAIEAMMAAKEFNTKTSNFPPNVVAAVAAVASVAKSIPPLAKEKLPTLIDVDPAIMNAISMEDIPFFVHLKHGSAHNEEETDMDNNIGVESFFNHIKTINTSSGFAPKSNNATKSIAAGRCWKFPACKEFTHPDEVDEVLRLLEAKEGGATAAALENYRKIADKYRTQYTMRFGVEGGPAGGAGNAGPAGGAGNANGRRTRRARRVQKGGANVAGVVDKIRQTFSHADDATCALPPTMGGTRKNRRLRRKTQRRRRSQRRRA